MKRAIVRQGWNNWLVIAGEVSKSIGSLVQLNVLAVFDSRGEADSRAELFNRIVKKCQKYCEKRQARVEQCHAGL